jgi:LacI family transcriptional regulator
LSKKPSLNDVARIAGVSKFSASMALREQKGVSEETRKKIKDAAEKLGYVDLKKCTSNNKSDSICVIINKNVLFDEKKSMKIYYAIQEQCIKEKINAIVSFYDERMSCNEIPNHVRDGTVKGIVIVGEIIEEYYRKLECYNLPLVMVDTYLEIISGNKILVDNVMSGYDATAYLINKGHTNIKFYGDENRPACNERWLGYIKAVKGAGLKPLNSLNNNNLSEATLCKKQCSAIICSGTESLLNIEQRLNIMGISIPDEMSIIVFDDCNITGMDNKYSLTTVTVPKTELGITGVKILLYKIKNPDSGGYKILIEAGITAGQTIKNLKQSCFDNEIRNGN